MTMKHTPYILFTLAALLLASGCVRRTISSRPGWKDPGTGKLMGITRAHEKTEESRIIWFWQPEFRQTRDTYRQTDSDASAAQ